MKHLYICDTCKAQFDNFEECNKHEKQHRRHHYKLVLSRCRDADGYEVTVVCGRIVPTGYLDEDFYGTVRRSEALSYVSWEVEFADKSEAPEMLKKLQKIAAQWYSSVIASINAQGLPEEYN